MSQSTRTVLIVDADPQILNLVRQILVSREAKVLSAPRPSDALKICEGEKVDLLISDYAMPEMDGNRLADHVLKLWPQALVLLMSGAMDGAAVRNGRVRNGQVKFLKKPFFPSDLIRVLEEMLPD